jgi:hypothetical protein
LKAINLGSVKGGVTSVLLMTSVMAIIPADVMSAPLTMSAIINEQLDYAPGCPSLVGGTISGTGISSPLGNISLAGNDCFTPIGTGFSFAGKMVITVSWGDELFADYSGSFTPTSNPSIFAFTNSIFKLTGGTGDFLKAKGSGKLLGGENIQTGLGFIYASGKISNFKQGKDHTGPKQAEQRIAGEDSQTFSDGLKGIEGLDGGLFPHGLTRGNGHTLGDYFYQDQNGQILAINGIPESASWSLLGIGLASLVAVRRRKLSNSSSCSGSNSTCEQSSI